MLVRSAWRGIAIVFVPHPCVLSSGGTCHSLPALSGFLTHQCSQYFLVVIVFYISNLVIFPESFRPENSESFCMNISPTQSQRWNESGVNWFLEFYGNRSGSGAFNWWRFFSLYCSEWIKHWWVVAANISIPPMIPLILYLSFKTGGWMLGERATQLAFTTDLSLGMVKAHMQQYLYGSIVFAFIAAVGTGLLSFLLIKIFNRKTDLAA